MQRSRADVAPPLLTPWCGATPTPPQVFEYTSDATRKVHSFQAHLDSCRTVKFVGDGGMLLSGSADCSILAMDSATGQVHTSTRLIPLPVGSQLQLAADALCSGRATAYVG